MKDSEFIKLFLGSYCVLSLLFPLHATCQEIYYESTSGINRGLLSESYWRSRSLQGSSANVLGYSDIKLGATAKIGNIEFVVEREEVAILSSNENSLFAAVTSKQAFNNSSTGIYPLTAKVNSYEYDALGIMLRNSTESNDINLVLIPKLLSLNSFKAGTGFGQLEVGTTSQRLTGSLSRQGLSSYGFLTNPNNLQIGTGGTLDAKLSYELKQNKFEIAIQNLMSKIPVNGYFNSDRSYQVTTQNGGLVFSTVPSLTGNYGQLNKSLKLPKILKTSWTSQPAQSNWAEKLGVISFEDGKIIWGEVDYKYGNSSIQVKTYELQNIFLTLVMNNLILNNLSLEVTVGSAFHAKNQLLITGLHYSF